MYSIDKKRIFWKQVNQEIVILDIESGVYFTLNEVGARIWELVLNDHNLDEIVKDLLCNFEVKEDVVYKDAQKIIRDLLRENILIEMKGVK